MLWGIVLGFWLVAPVVVSTHHLHPVTTSHWGVLLGALGVIFALLGVLLGFIGAFALLVIEGLIRGPFTERRWAYALFSAITVTLTYAVESFAIHWLTYESFNFEPSVYQGAIIFGLSCVTAVVALSTVYRAIVIRRPTLRPAALGWALGATAATGALALVVRTPPPPPLADVGALEALPAAGEDVPLLFIGLDGGSWRLLRPAIEKGAAPTLQGLVERGITGTVDALWPPYWSGAAWGAILTGQPRETTGVYEDLAASAPGLPLFQAPLRGTLRLNPFYAVRSILVANGIISFTPPPRALLRAKPVWQLLHEAGVQSAVVRFRFTYPPRGQADIAVSDWVGHDQWEGLGARRWPTLPPVAPDEMADRLLAPFQRRELSDPGLFGRLLPGPRPQKPADVILNPIRELEVASDIDDRTFEVSESIVRSHPQLPFLAVYIGGLDSAQHGFWQYRFPNDFPGAVPSQSDIDRLGRVPDEYVRYLDDRLKQLLSLYASEPNVMIVSDHGAGPTTLPSGWRGWHAREGMFIAAGPSVPHVRGPVNVSYYDVLPTIARLKGFRAPNTIAGRSVVIDATDSTHD